MNHIEIAKTMVKFSLIVMKTLPRECTPLRYLDKNKKLKAIIDITMSRDYEPNRNLPKRKQKNC